MPLLLPSLLWSLLGVAPASTDALCAGRAPCRVVETLAAGTDARGQPLSVVHLDLGWFAFDDVPERLDRKLGPGRKEQGRLVENDCAAAEWWAVSPESSQLLLAVCNDGYGSAEKGEDVVKVKDGLVSHARTGGGGQLWRHTRVLRLSPWSWVREGHVNFAAGRDDVEDSALWDFTTLQGSRSLGPSLCKDGPSAPNKRTLPYLPRVAMDAAYLDEGWKRSELGACALPAKHAVGGKAPAARDASLKALLVAPDVLILEVRDDHWVGEGGHRWREEDHVQLWLGPKSPEALTGCGKPEAGERLVQWALGVTTGSAFLAYGKSLAKPEVERVELRGAGQALEGYRLKVTLPPGSFAGLGLAYSDADPGQEHARLLATSPLKFSRPETLNIVREVPAAEGTCEARGGALEVVPTPARLRGPDVAVFPAGTASGS